MTEADKKPPTLGKDIPWKRVEGAFLRVKSCVFFASIQDGNIKAPAVGAYAVLEVECPQLPGEALVMVSNKIDFKHLWELYKERQLADGEEVLFGYAPLGQRGLGRLIRMFLPCLDIWVYPKGHFEEANDPNFKPQSTEAWVTPRARWTPSEP